MDIMKPLVPARRATVSALAAAAILAICVLLSACPGSLFNPPAGLRCVAESTTSIRVSWEPLAFAASYRLYWGDSSPAGLYMVETEETSALLAGLRPSQGYYFSVTGVNYAGESPRSVEESCYTLDPDWPAPTNLVIEQNYPGELHLTWTSVPDAGWYRIRWRQIGDDDYLYNTAYTNSYDIDHLIVTGYSVGVAVYTVTDTSPYIMQECNVAY
jgi:hypothetical protein